ncbi:cerebellin-3-like [Saccostrea echinata]|uniref:cerebellin-3-like n=1 Tax=Saccostrea echinata TaxID=191078 RepID=UPI002A821921|nr:cerebellin-3-like [Saccostrea echinata]
MFQALVKKLEVVTDENRRLQEELKNIIEIMGRQTASIDKINKTIGDIRTDVKQFQSEQLMLSSIVSSLEVFRINMTRSYFELTQKVSFTAGVTSDSSSWNSGTLVFNKVISNEGGGYDPINGIFTAPVVGNYVFYVSIQGYKDNDIYVDIVLNGSSEVRAMVEANSASNEQYETGTNLVILRLQQGDRVWVRHYDGSGYATFSDAPVTTFSGFLI